MIDDVVAALAKLERKLLAIGRVLQVVAELADRGVGRFVDADERDLPRRAARRRLCMYISAGTRTVGDMPTISSPAARANLRHVGVGVGRAVHAADSARRGRPACR